MNLVEPTPEDLKAKISKLERQLDSAQKNYHTLIDKTNQNLKDLFDNSNDLIILFRSTGEIRFANEAVKNKLGYQENEVSNLKFLDLVHEDHRREALQNILKITAGSRFEKFETVLISKTEKNVYVTGKMTAVFENNEPIEYRCVFYDITERIRAESAQSLYYQIGNITITENDLEQLYQNIYKQLNQMLKVKNFQINLRERKAYRQVFCINEKMAEDKMIFDVDQVLMDYAIERNRSLIIYQEGIEKIAEQQKIKFHDPVPKIWLGVRINTASATGIMSVCSYKDQSGLNNKDLELLDYIAGQISLAMERQDKEETIESQAATLGAIFDSSTHEIWSVDKKLRFTSFNENYEEAFQRYYDIAPKIGESLQEVSLDKLSMQRVKFWIEKYNEAFDGNAVNFQIKTKDRAGRMIWREVFINPIFLPDGRIEEIAVLANDISEKKESESALIESEEKFRNIFVSFQDVYFRCDMDGIITMMSPSVLEVIGYSSKDVLGTSIMDYADDKRQILQMFTRVADEKRIRNIEAKIKSSSGDKLSLLFNIRLIHKDDQGMEIEGVARDITQLRQANEQLKKAKETAEHSLKVKERFLANMSHEIRTPMNGIIGMIDVLASTPLDGEQTEFVKTINKSSQTLLNILNDILDLSKIEAGKMDLKREPIDLLKTMEKVYSLYTQQASQKGHTLFYHVDPEIPKWILADETRLIQIISNLTSNSIKFNNKKGDINMSIRIQERIGNTYLFKVSVKDSGIGISEEDKEALFQSFHQLDNSSSKNFGGTGLGLAISKELVRAMAGEIGVVSTVGLGSTFWFTFKSTKVDSDHEEPQSDTALRDQFINQKPRILLVDDNDVNRKVASNILIKSGCSVIEAVDGFQAIEKVQHQRFDLILMDIQMPKMDGTEATQKIRDLGLKKCPPIIAMTAYSMEEDRDRFIGAGLDDYLSKPIKADALIRKIKEWLQLSHEVQENGATSKQEKRDQVINQETLDQLAKYGGQELISSALADFEEEATQLVRNTIMQYKDRNFAKMKGELHTLKGNSGTLGVEKLATQAAYIERKLKENNFDHLKEELVRLNELFKEFKALHRKIPVPNE
ncbi:MAG: PAS domain S-box protein [Bacteroidota bacterium]